ncbi:hypothetical protein [Brenneria uluponensis]|uniref:hypothetical protein n=1 Tax=Brenneria uluponensis TaxID=3057057 RepID=UPI0028E18A50|nr:hypothetical protein [Brenneria ulupoensis]
MLTTKFKLLLDSSMMVAAFAMGWYIQGLRWDKAIAERDKTHAVDVSTSQQSIIAGQALAFQHFNQIAAEANQYAINIKSQSDEKQIVYRTIIKRDPAGRQCVPDDVAKRLLDHTYRLRASAMHTTASRTDTTSAGAAATTCRLTYAQAIYWIDPLLTAIDQANSQLTGIREAELTRASH